jgi:predicted enzyme related to lactoylglutathione lyase
MVGGCWQMDPSIPAQVPPFWLVYFAVTDCDGMVAKAKQLGANVTVEPADVPNVGRFAVVMDPSGAAFGFLQPAQG